MNPNHPFRYNLVDSQLRWVALVESFQRAHVHFSGRRCSLRSSTKRMRRWERRFQPLLLNPSQIFLNVSCLFVFFNPGQFYECWFWNALTTIRRWCMWLPIRPATIRRWGLRLSTRTDPRYPHTCRGSGSPEVKAAYVRSWAQQWSRPGSLCGKWCPPHKCIC